MIAIDFLRKFDTRKIVDILISTPDFFDFIDWNNRISIEEKIKLKNIAKEDLIKEFENIKKNQFLKNDKGILVVQNRYYQDYRIFDIYLFDYKNFDINTINENKFNNCLQGLAFSTREEILGLEISNYCIEKYGEDAIIQAIANGITNFSIYEDDRQNKINNAIKDVEESYFESLKEDAKTFTIEEVEKMLFDKFGFKSIKRTEEEKEQIRQKSIRENIELNKERNEIIINTYNYYINK